MPGYYVPNWLLIEQLTRWPSLKSKEHYMEARYTRRPFSDRVRNLLTSRLHAGQATHIIGTIIG